MAEPFKPGDKIVKSGIYAVVHDGAHAAPQEVTCLAGQRFPPCDECGPAVRFRVVKLARHVARQEHFRGYPGSPP